MRPSMCPAEWMKKVLIVPLVAVALVAAACANDDGGDPTTIDPRPSVHFFNAMTGMSGSGGFTANGQFVAGSALAFGQSTQPCSRLEPGVTTFDFGEANAAGTALTGTALSTLPNETLTNGGEYTVAAVGNNKHSLLFMLNNSFTGTLGSNQAAVRFVNLVAATLEPFNVSIGTSPHATNLGLGTASTFATLPSGTTAFTILLGDEVVITDSPATLNLQSGSVNTVAIVRNGTMDGGFKLINLPRCS